jgi:hypothetical protein
MLFGVLYFFSQADDPATRQDAHLHALVAAGAVRGRAPGGSTTPVRSVHHGFSSESWVIISREAAGDNARSAAAWSKASR